jgi:tripartite ATP-independent transporter DctP family solute receptor
MRKQFIRFVCVVLCTLIADTGAAAAPQTISLVFNSSFEGPQRVGADELRRKLGELAADRFVVDERGSIAAGSENAIMSAVQNDTIDVTVVTGAVVSAVVPEFGVFDVPFLFRDAAQAKAVADGPVGTELAAHFSDKGLVLLAIGKQGFRHMTNSRRPIRAPEDVKGLKIRVLPNPIYEMTFKALGAEVVPMEFPLVYAALKDGRIDGEENAITSIATSHFEDVQKYLSMTGHFFAPIAFLASKEMFDQLKPADQAALLAAAKAGAEATWQRGDEEDKKMLDGLRKGGMEIIDKVDRQPFIDAVKPLEPEFEKRFGKDLLTQIRATP